MTLRSISAAVGSATVGLAAAVALTACSSSTGGKGEVKPPSHNTLVSVGVQAGDVPSGWQGAKAERSDSGDAAVQSQVLACEGGGKIDAASKIESVDSDDFSQGDNTISSSATSYKSQTEVDNRLAVILSPKADTCFSQAFKTELAKTLPSGATIDNVSFHIVAGSSGGPAGVVGSAVGQVTLSNQGQTAALFLNETFIKGPLLGATVQFTGVGQAIDPAVQKQVIEKVAARVAKA